MNNKIFRINFSGLGGFILLIIFIALGILALTFFAVFIGAVVVLVIAGFIIRRILNAVGIKKSVTNERTEEKHNAEYFHGKMIEIPEYKVEDDDEPSKKDNQLN